MVRTDPTGFGSKAGYYDPAKKVENGRVRIKAWNLLLPAYNEQNQIWDKVEQKNTDFVNRHACVMDGIELLSRHPEPSTVKSLQPVVSQDEEQKPTEQYRIVDDRAPQKQTTYYLHSHGYPPFGWTLEGNLVVLAQASSFK